jgi:hypothetical protein
MRLFDAAEHSSRRDRARTGAGLRTWSPKQPGIHRSWGVNDQASMRSRPSHPPFDHGAALRVPPPNDAKSWRLLWLWLGENAQAVAEAAAVQVRTPHGLVIAHCGDWIVLTASGAFHVARGARTCDA